jgi:two-component system CheB/CheR fusion protein
MQPVRAPFPIVGIGASAGGLVALERFLSAVASGSGMAYVVVQHLDPNRSGMLVELLQRQTSMPTEEVQDQMRIEPNHVYVIPPGRDISVLNGVLHLFEPPEPRGLRLPIDFFFKSLADDRHQNSIGVILSGMGSDGTAGLRAIRHAAGGCFVQLPSEAQFDSMPRSAIAAGVVDVIATAQELPEKILHFVNRVHISVPAHVQSEVPPKDSGFLDKVLVLLRSQTGQDFSHYKKSTISRRVERRMGLHQLSRTDDYLRYLRENPQECQLLFNELLIGVTSFFRDAVVWEHIKAQVIPALVGSSSDAQVLRAWVPACSTGEEAYSWAMVFKEVVESLHPAQMPTLQVFATDLDSDAIATGRAGVYASSISADVSDARLSRFFAADPGGYRICNEIREMVIFAEQNIIVSPPFIKLDLLSCRNLLIYLKADLQEKLIQLFHYCLNPGGFLVLGRAESVGTACSLFSPLDATAQIYRRLETSSRVLPVDFPVAFVHAEPHMAQTAAHKEAGQLDAPNLQLLVEQAVLTRHGPAAVLVKDDGNALYFCGETGKYLELAVGKPNLNVLTLVRAGLGPVLADSLRRAVREKVAVKSNKVKMDGCGPGRYVDLVVDPLEDPVALRGTVLVVFKDAVTPRRPKMPARADVNAGDGAPLQSEGLDLQQSRQEATAIREQMQTAQEELKSINEEFQSANEELQSTNEELTTSKEEMQSMNEELQTLNKELQAKVAELSRANNDMKNLLDSTEIATLFLDDALHVRRFTPKTTQVIKLIPGDAGRPITDIVTDLVYPGMALDAQEVLRTLVFREADVPTKDGRWYRVRTMPYRTLENRIDGLVITFSDITVSKSQEGELNATKTKLASLIEEAVSKEAADGLS